jgi:hypothetical protein
MVLGAGCLYTAPVWRMNEPPIITVPNVDPGVEVIYDLGLQPYIIVLGDDPDSTELSCWWDVPGTDVQSACTMEGTQFTTVLRLDYNPELEGALIVAHIYDRLSQQEVRVSFRIQSGSGELL